MSTAAKPGIIIRSMRRVIAVLGVVGGLLALHGGPAAADESGWAYLIDRLAADGLSRAAVTRAFADWRVPAFDGLEFSPDKPRESHRLYRGFLRSSGVAAARRCRIGYADAFERAARAHGVSADVLASILFVESGCGRNSGSSVVLYRLARLAMANEPDNVERNLERLSRRGELRPETEARLRARAHYLENTFYPEVRAIFEVARRMGVDPLEIRGSGSGAFGWSQFLPTSYLRYGADGDGDGRISLYDVDDAAASCARYLAAHGWRPGISLAQRRGAIWEYNHSPAYIDTVLRLAARLGGEPPPPVHKKPGRRRHAPRPRHHHRR